ncbi:TPA: S-adenosylmethionine-binding protein [Candidatus Edwardsbacteria bacterium]|nr:S-adenosylmethionine-binding protein [Candidatus Edwardsbacteria bacterium]HBZ85950.1 S-adenosylmethionine-binding protein [Candidatus Edwardsbacteria bacterium]
MEPTIAEIFVNNFKSKKYGTILADPPWRFNNRSGKVAPEHKRLNRYDTLSLDQIKEMPIPIVAAEKSHLYLWVPNALLPEGLEVMKAWGFEYKTNMIWHKVRKDGGPDGRGVGFYFRNTTEVVLFGIRGKVRTLGPGRSQVNIIRTQKQEHSRKPDELYKIIEKCSSGPYLELFARGKREGWDVFGNQTEKYYPSWSTYKNHSQATSQTVVLEKRKKYKKPVIKRCHKSSTVK